MKKLILLLIFLMFCNYVNAQWSYSWYTRTDVDGKPAGIYTITPFPITEVSTTYSLTTDEGTTEYTLGTLYFVDGAKADDTGDGLSLANAKKTITAAITAAGTGNKTIIIRGAHDAFDGVYSLAAGITPYAGTSNTLRFTLVGYGQERPVLDGGHGVFNIIRTTTQTNAYVTVQRLKIQNSRNTGVRLGTTSAKRDGYFNLIDVEVTNCVSSMDYSADGQIYYMNMDNGYISHVTAHHGLGHGIKFGDGSSNGIIEWSKAYECGYWSTMVADMVITNWAIERGSHPSAIDLPNDSGIEGASNKVRYNIAYDSLFYGMQLRNTSSVDVHHNEVYNTPHWDDVPGVSCASNGVSSCPQLLLFNLGIGCYLSGSVYSNVIRDSTDATANGIGLNGLCNDRTVNIYNNLLYGNNVSQIHLRGYSVKETRVVNVHNNTISHSGTGAAIEASTNWASDEVTLTGNVVYVSNNKSAIALDADIARDYNLYYYPSGSRGSTAGANDVNAGASTDPLFVSLPSGAYVYGMGNLSGSSSAIDAFVSPPSMFSTDFILTPRPQSIAWDIGWHEYISGATTTTSTSTTSTSTSTSSSTTSTGASTTVTTSSTSTSTSSTSSTTTTLFTISSIVATSLNSSQVEITWTTSTASSTQVEYGLTTSYEIGSFINGDLVMSHSIIVWGLSAGLTYHFQPISTDVTESTTYGADGTFSIPGTSRSRLRKVP